MELFQSKHNKVFSSKTSFIPKAIHPCYVYVFLDNNICKALGSQSPPPLKKTVYKFVFSFLWAA